jgi:hypothetical protein
MGSPQFNRKELIQKILLEDKVHTLLQLTELTDLEIYKYYLCQKKMFGK